MSDSDGIILKPNYRRSSSINREQPANSDFNREIISSGVTNPQIVGQWGDTKCHEDIILYGEKNFSDFCTFYNYGPNGKSLLKVDKDNYWETTPNGNYNSFDILFKHHSIRLTHFALRTAVEKHSETTPKNFYIYGYNSHLRRWDILLERCGKSLDTESRYVFEIKKEFQNNFYRIIDFSTTTGVVALSYVQLYGDIITENDEPPHDEARKGSIEIDYEKKPSFVCQKGSGYTKGILKTATSFYGPLLINFVDVYAYHDEDSKVYDVWEARDFFFIADKKDGPKFVSIYFPYHEVFISGYQIKPAHTCSIDRWCVIGCQDDDDCGKVLDLQLNEEFDPPNLYYSFKIDNSNKCSFRVIRLVGLTSIVSFDCFDIYGSAIPVSSSKYMLNKRGKRTFNVPDAVYSYYKE